MVLPTSLESKVISVSGLGDVETIRHLVLSEHHVGPYSKTISPKSLYHLNNCDNPGEVKLDFKRNTLQSHFATSPEYRTECRSNPIKRL